MAESPSLETIDSNPVKKMMQRHSWCVSVLHSSATSVLGLVKPFEKALAIGREGSPQNLVIDDREVSRSHATIRHHGGLQFEIEDHSKNGTYVDGVRVQGKASLAPGNIIRVGDTLLELDEITPAELRWQEDAEFLGRALVFRSLRQAIDRIAPTELSVLVIGETGTGKELVARRLHAMSGRQGPLIAVNCGAMPANLIESALFGHKRGAFTDAHADAAGYFSAAAGGTLFLDEIGVLPLDLQPKLLRVLENKEYTVLGTTTPKKSDVRVVAATNVDLAKEAGAGRFRRDLYARLAQFQLDVPPLRARRTDILRLFSHFMAAFSPERAKQLRFTATFAEALLLYDWPMNLRELKALAQRLVVLVDAAELTVDDLPPQMRPGATPGTVSAPEEVSPVHTEQPTKAELEQALVELGGNLSAVAARYGRSRMQLYRWMMKHQLDPQAYRH